MPGTYPLRLPHIEAPTRFLDHAEMLDRPGIERPEWALQRAPERRDLGLDRLIERMEREEFDLIAVGRALISDPRWVAKVRASDALGLRGFDVQDLAALA